MKYIFVFGKTDPNLSIPFLFIITPKKIRFVKRKIFLWGEENNNVLYIFRIY